MTASQFVSQLPGYILTELLYPGTRTFVYRGVHQQSQQPVVIKVMKRDYPTFGELAQFRNQFVITKNLQIPGIVRSLALEGCGNGYAIIMEDSGSISVAQYLENQTLNLLEILDIAIQVTAILHDLHQQRIIHKDIKPANILIHPDSGQITLIDFSIASLLPKEIPAIQSPQGLEGTLAYLAPEQTGRMNRGIDYRTDFYALGVTLYELLTGQLPFRSDDPLEVIHSHIAKTPTPVHEVNPEIPVMVGAIAAKLMAKNAEDRYQSALGLQYDLQECLNQWQARGAITEFALGQRDLSDRFNIPEKLYGRETEVAQLLTAFERVAEGTSELLLVAGFSGIGKTAVINEVHKPIVRQRGYFIKGKFDQFNRNIPLDAFIQAFRDLVGQLLSESDQQLQIWKAKILAALTESAQVIIDLIPELERITGPQPPASELSGEAAQNRFNLLFQNFIQVFATVEHPLVIFIDDLQWADSASLSFMQRLLTKAQGQYLLVLGAYRDNEVFPGHPFLMTVHALEKANVTLETLTLGPLNADSLNHLIADAFQTPASLVQPLTSLVMQKTQGNPFFATQFLKALHQDGLITFDHEARHWQCDLVQVQDAALTDDVVAFMALQLQKLPIATQEQLKFAACIGAEFDLKTLAIVSEQAQTQVASVLWPALQEGLILPESKIYKFYLDDDQPNNHQALIEEISEQINYRFFHDRVQQAAYSLIPENEKQQTHYRIATLLQRNTSATEQEERLFEILNHLNLSRALVTEPAQRTELSRLNLRAAHKAKAATAYVAAIEYLSVGMEILPADCWQQEYDFTLALHNAMAEAQYLSTNFVQMENWAQIVLQQANSLLDTIKVQQIRILGMKAEHDLESALDIGLEVLKGLSVEFPDQPAGADIGKALTKTAQLWAGKSPLQLIDLPEMVDAHRLAAMQIMTELIPCAYRRQPSLFPLLVCTQVDFSIQFGNCPVSTFAYADYGVILCGILDQIEAGYEFGQLALAVIEKFKAHTCKCRTGFIVNTLVSHWKEPLHDLRQPILNAYHSGLETGDLESAALNAHCYCLSSYLVGQELTSLVPEIATYREAIRALKQVACRTYVGILQQVVVNLHGGSDMPWKLQGPIYHAETLLAQAESECDRYEVFQYYTHSVYLLYLFHHIPEAAQQLKVLESYLDGGVSNFLLVLYVFYDALVQLALYPQTSTTEQPHLLARVQQQQEKLQRWGTLAPGNHQHRWELVEAERCRVVGDRVGAIEYYDRAIATAQKHQFLQDEALANEVAAQFYLAWDKEKIAAGYLQEAYYCYSRWGAKAKVVDLETRYPHLLRPILQPLVQSLDLLNTVSKLSSVTGSITTGTQHTNSSSSLNQTLDLASVLKASQALSGTLQLDELLIQLTQIILQNSGGDRCVLIIPNDVGVWQVRAISTPDEIHLCTDPLDYNPELPLKLIQYVKNTQKLVVVDNLETNLSILDEYLQNQQPKSILCLPILNQGRCIGIVYLKNSLTRGVFTTERIVVLNFLCTQAAISLENARLYQQVQQSLTDLQQAQLQLVQSEKMSALGGLVSGVAHEINNPAGCILGNVGATENYVKDLLGLLELYGEAFPEPGDEIESELEAVDLEYLREDLPQLIRAMRDSGDRIKCISHSLRTFSRKDTDHKQPFNLHEGIESTLLILRHRLKGNEHRPEIKVAKAYNWLNPVNCFPGQLNQVFMNILANAIDVFDDLAHPSSFAEIKAQKQQITIQIQQVENWVEIKIADNGAGIPEEIQSKIFDHLFTTKAVGKGTGLGLAIARQIVEEKHGGFIQVNSILGQGTEFIISLPTQA
ncbi:putative ATPase [Oscillatoria acuminata PCC 6304]|uniref:histidine kinase n=2 Tax=Oscillatoria acuminata TaxID=118323 RepID=K9TIK2_9CYAN|nr:putative ATPase [Oscillatoria acuminata PCC 6304]